ncbi:MAG: bifunctional riboflavin kinase/FAD synthetase [Chloroflexi bacterium]|nr:bifunctional riboflavin kinase/FAD synthetase [Chloroflexota bacterium]
MLTELARQELRRVASGRPCAVAIGVFDGVHRGHQFLVERLRGLAREQGLASVVLTFHPAPVSVLRPDVRISYITTLEERLELLRGLGVDEVGRLTFTSDLAQVSASDFVRGLRDELDIRLLVGGPDLSVGRAREGTVEWLKAHEAELGVAVETVAFIVDGDRKMGSTAIREALGRGDVESVGQVLGRPFALHGPVVHGAHRGRTIGFPTANIAIGADLAVPAFGVYVSRVHVGEASYNAVTNIGRRPTFDDGPPTIEAHLLDFDGDLYGHLLRLELLSRLRGEVKFSGIDELVAQIRRDVEATRKYFGRT